MRKKGDDVHPIVLVVIGAVVAIVSLVINATQDTNFTVFLIVGLVMASYGLVKYLILGRNSSDALGPAEKPSSHQNSGGRPHNTPRQQPVQCNVMFCPHCGLRLQFPSNFCPRCGMRLR